MLKALETAELATGFIFRRSSLAAIEKELEQQYRSLGRYNIFVDTEIIALPENRVAINIIIDEGNNSVITYINVIGNDSFSDTQIRDLMQLKTDNFLSLFTSSSQYSREKLSADLETIRSFYLDRGYVLFAFESTQVAISADRREIFITISVDEGPRFAVNQVTVAGELPVAKDTILGLVKGTEGDIFSRQKLVNASDEIRRLLGEDGYINAQVEPIPLINQVDDSVDVQFVVRPGKRTYIRRINFIGNTRTEDQVLRREMLILESSLVSLDAIRSSRLRLQRLGFFSKVDVETVPVPGTDDLVDVNFKVEEGLTASWSVRVGYTDGEGVFWGGNISQRNFLGTGNEVEASFTTSVSTNEFNFRYVNPYFTPSGVSRGFNIFYVERDYAKISVSSYATDRIGGSVNFGYPLSAVADVDLGLGYETINLTAGATAADEIKGFVAAEGTNYQQWRSTLTWTQNTLNDFWYPTDGSSHSLSLQLELPNSSLQYHRTTYNYRYFTELDAKADYVGSLGLTLGYVDTYGATKATPPFANYFAGGVGTVRGFDTYSLGPRASDDSTLGGQVLTAVAAELIVPLFSDTPAVRTAFFVDVGNVFNANQYKVDELRSAAGFTLAWLTPVGPLTFVLATPLESQAGDRLTRTHLSLGRSY